MQLNISESTFGFIFPLESNERSETHLTFGVLAVFAISLYLLYLKRTTTEKYPPSCKGWIPWLGCAIQFGKSPLSFMEEKRKELGPVFTLYVAGEQMTFLTEPEDFHHFFGSPDVDFQMAVKEVVNNVASIDEVNFFKFHTMAHDTVKGKLAPNNLCKVIKNLCGQFNHYIDEYLDVIGEQDLLEKVKCSMYASILNNLFGDNTFPVSDKEKFDEILRNFKAFDEDFEVGAKVPEVFLPKWSKAKSFFIKTFRDLIGKVNKEQLPKENMTLLEAFADKIKTACCANYCMMILWASLANAIPMTFWTLCYILSDRVILAKIKEDLNRVFQDRKNDSEIDVTEEDLVGMPYLRWCVLETIRLKSVGAITRRVVRQFTIRDYVIKKGSMLMLSPFWAHRNERVFPEPEVFRPERWINCDSNKGVFMDGFVAFGGGRYQCPGRWFALLEIQMFIALFLLKFDSQVCSEIPQGSTAHVVGTQHPVKPFLVTCSRKK